MKKLEMAQYIAKVLYDKAVIFKPDHHEVKALMKKKHADLVDLTYKAIRADDIKKHAPEAIRIAYNDILKNMKARS